jgi:O-antigen/teichoic acid export membrane protein
MTLSPARRNVFAATVQTLATGVILVVLYRYLYAQLGIELFGVWALILAVTGTVSFSGMGLGASTVKFVAQYHARGDSNAVGKVIRTAVTSVALLVGAALPLLYPVLAWILGHLLESPPLLREGIAILPFAFLAFWLITIGTVFQGCLDGLHRVDLRAGLVTTGYLAFLIMCVVWVPEFGLMGVAFAQVVQGGILCLGGAILMRYAFGPDLAIPLGWDRPVFREMIGYGVNFQVISVTTLLFEPTTKALLTLYGGIGLTGFYEMAYRMAIYLRSIVSSAHQALVPTIARLHEVSPSELILLYKRSFKALFLLVALALPLLLLTLPSLTTLWLGERLSPLVTFASILVVAWFINLLSNPSYFAYMGIGRLKWNMLSHLLMAGLNVVLGIFLGWAFGGTGVVLGFALALTAGSIVLPLFYHKEYAVSLYELFDRQSGVIALVAGLFALVVLFTPALHTRLHALPVAFVVVAVYLAITVFLLRTHALRAAATGMVRSLFSEKPTQSAEEV